MMYPRKQQTLTMSRNIETRTWTVGDASNLRTCLTLHDVHVRCPFAHAIPLSSDSASERASTVQRAFGALKH